jgi:Flp pilus assembly pilin Flp
MGAQVLDVKRRPVMERPNECRSQWTCRDGRAIVPASFYWSTYMGAVRRFLRSDDGIAVTEYGLLVALVAVLLIGVVVIFGSSISSWFQAKTSVITTA